MRFNRFLILAGILLILMISRSCNGVWGGDFWEHSAVVRELATHPLSPAHPQLALDVPHVMFSPYTLGVALIARLSGSGPVMALSVAGIINLIVLLFGVRLFVGLALGNGKTSFYTLLFMLFLWGTELLEFSGFFHFATLGYVLAYPSMFCSGLMCITLSCSILFFQQGRRGWLALIFILSAFILLSHPATAMVLFVGLAAVAIAYGGVNRQLTRGDYALYCAVIPAAFLVALIWPYYPFGQMIHESAGFHRENRYIYEKLLQRTFPALVVLPLLVQRIRENKRDLLVWMFAGLLVLFVYGAVSKAYGYGRALSYMMIILHMIAAAFVVKWETKHKWLVGAAVVLMVPFLLSGQFRVAMRQCLPGAPDTYKKYAFLSAYTGQYDIVLSDIYTGWIVPTFGGKSVAALHGALGVPDNDQRMEDIKTFFEIGTAMRERAEILRKYEVDFVLINKERGEGPDLSEFGDVVYSDGQFVLVKVEQ